jgi:SAM-dependent methyltransferase
MTTATNKGASATSDATSVPAAATPSATPVTGTPDDQALKARHRAMWASGHYEVVATDAIADLGPVVVAAAKIGAGDRVLDVGAGSGNAAIPASRAGATVVANDLTPELLEIGRAQSTDLDISWEVGDAESLPYGDGEFDAVISCVGVMFAPHHQTAADEMVRVCRSGGRIANVSWTPGGFIGQMFATMKPYAPPPAPGVQPPPLWGNEAHVRELLGDRVTDVVTEVRDLPVPLFTSGQSFLDFFKTNYGPTIAVYKNIGDDAERGAELDIALIELADKFGAGAGAMEWEYLLVTAKRS